MTNTIELLVYLTHHKDRVERCIHSVLAHTPKACPITFISESMPQVLTQLVSSWCNQAGRSNVKFLNHTSRLGYDIRMIRALQGSSSQYVALLNDYIIVHENWISKLYACIVSEPCLGISCPFISGGIRQSLYPSLPSNSKDVCESLDRKSKREYPRITSADICLLINRAVLGKVNLKTFKIKVGLEPDLCHEARRYGFNVAIADDLFVGCDKDTWSPLINDDEKFFKSNPLGRFRQNISNKKENTHKVEIKVEDDELYDDDKKEIVKAEIQQPSQEKIRDISIVRSFPTTSIIIPVHNQLEILKKCIRSVVIKSHTPCQIAIVNDGSDESTTNYCNKLWDTGIIGAYIHNTNAIGFSEACNQGLRSLKSEYYCLLNSDTIIGTDDWLRLIIENTQKNAIPPGVVGVLSNKATSQTVIDSEDISECDIDKWAEIVSAVTEYRNPKTQLVHGFCYIMQKQVLRSVGFLDSKNFPHYGSEDDYTMRVSKKGFQPIIVDSVFVFHKGRASYGHDRHPLTSKALVKLQSKWGRNNIHEAMRECIHSLSYIKEKIKRYAR